ncbi:hypothetical protein AVEN_63847-1 [Araneus ventricosus]|uniref:Uncharacterized protein n=1 Tax=Araneus ventricosus TaxID=182803 RepID=A0A4Y2C4R4_ARAVE|nr:hypothetical protein AVEN_254978-1 [Araneus ventricosus]GBL99511.1 hypothetical protein AVEN_63847-1 [Araneus ventricosus]
MWGKGRPLHYATSCPLTSSFHFTKPSAEHILLWWKNLLLNKPSRIKIDKFISFLTDNEDLIKQQPDQSVHPTLVTWTPTQISLLHQDLRLVESDP